MFRYAKEVNACLKEVQKGNLKEFRELYDMTAMHLFGVAKMYLVNKSLADDVVSVTFIKALKYIDSYDTQQDGYNWLCRITQNVARTFNKKEYDVLVSEEKFAKQQVSEYIESGFECIDFFMLLDDLDDIDKQVAYQRFYEGKTLQQIGDHLNITKVAVYQRIRKICKIIEKKIKK